MTVDARERALALSKSGKTYVQVAALLNKEQVPRDGQSHVWTRQDVEGLLRQAADAASPDPSPVNDPQGVSAPTQPSPASPQSFSAGDLERLQQLVQLRDAGALSEDEFAAQKASIGSMAPVDPVSPERPDPKSAAKDGAMYALAFFVFFPLMAIYAGYRKQISWAGALVMAIVLTALYGLAVAAYTGRLGSSDRISRGALESSMSEKMDAALFSASIENVASGEDAVKLDDLTCVKKDDNGANWSCLASYSDDTSENIAVTVDEDGSWVSE